MTELDDSLGPLRDVVVGDPLVGLARSLPTVGTQVRAADALVGATDTLLEAGQAGLSLVDELVTLRERNDADPDFQLMPALVGLMADSSDEVEHIAGLIDTARVRLDEIPPDAIDQVLEARDLMREPLDAYGPLLETYREVDDVLPGLLGEGDPRRYLVLAQNPAELRPTGGYAGTVGVVGLEDGRIVEQRFRNVNDIDRTTDAPFQRPPDDLAAYLLGDDQSWRLADANWSPDFPTSAQQALEFYTLETGDADLDGVIAVTTYALDRLLEVVGPVRIPDYGVTVRPGDTTMTLLAQTRGEPGELAGRKEILDALAREVLRRLMRLSPERWPAMVSALEDIGRQRQALAWFRDEAAQDLAETAGWSGAVRQDEGDYLAVVEANVAPTSKYNLVVERSTSLVVKLSEDGTALDSVRLDWTNEADRRGEPYASLRAYSNSEEGLYGAHVRALVPAGSELVAASGRAADEISGVGSVGEEAGRTSFANYLLIAPGEATLTYAWVVPGAAVETDDGWEYRLVIQKQPGARAEPLSIRIDLPEGASVIEATEGAVVDGDRVRYETTLVTDLELRVLYELAEGGTDG
jgi:hypothetical protein